MPNLEFQSLELANFRSFTKTQTLQLAPAPGLYFLRGRNEVDTALASNGAGKSSLVAAISWCLTGQTPEGLRNPDVKSWGAKDPAEVTLKLTGKTITRKAVTNGVTIDGKEVGSDEPLNQLGISASLLANTILLAQGQPLFLDLPPKDKMKLFADVLALESWDGRSAKAASEAKALELALAEIDGEISGAEQSLVQLEELLASASIAAKGWEAERRGRLALATKELVRLDAELALRVKELGEADLAYDQAETELVDCRKKASPLQSAVMAAKGAVTQAEAELRALQREKAELQRELAELGEGDLCSKCGQKLKGTSLEKHKLSLQKEIKLNEAELKKGVPRALTEAVAEAESALEAYQEAETRFIEKSDQAHDRLNYLKPLVAELKVKLNTARDVAAQEKEGHNPYQEQVQTLRRKKAQAEVALRELKEESTAAARQFEQTKFWVKGFKNVQLYLIEEVLQELELTVNATLAEVGLDGWSMKFAVEKETKSGTLQKGLHVTIISPRNKAPVRWESWSGGEAQRLRLIGALALSDVLLNHADITTNMEILDEPTQHLSAAGVNDLCEFLRNRAERLQRTVWLIDHHARESSGFAGVVTVVKTKEGSKIEQQ